MLYSPSGMQYCRSDNGRFVSTVLSYVSQLNVAMDCLFMTRSDEGHIIVSVMKIAAR